MALLLHLAVLLSLMSTSENCVPTVDPEEDIQRWLDELDAQTTLASMVSQMSTIEPTSPASSAPTTTGSTTTTSSTTTSSTTTSATTTIPTTCDPGWVRNPSNGRCYLVVTTSMIFADAENYCVGQNPDAHLVSIQDSAEDTFVYDTVTATLPGPNRSYWIGLIGLANAPLGWTDGTTFTNMVDYSNWSGSNPNAPMTADRCVVVSANTVMPASLRLWDDTNTCSTFGYYAVCEVAGTV